METEVDELIDAPAEVADIEIGLHSRWQDAKKRLFIVVGMHDPQIHKSRVRSTTFDLLEVNMEFSRPVKRPDFEGWIRDGMMIRVTRDVAV